MLIPSIARHAGKKRVLCEAYGISSLDIRLGGMLKRAQMFGINGIDDIALMGFHQSLDGIRKLTYWPPLFTEAPWWEFYPEYRDSCARSLSLTAQGTRKHRYAILYPQNELEQADLLDGNTGALTGPGSRVIDRLSDAVYAASESFDFIFPEILSQARGSAGKIVFPNAEYEAILAPSDIRFFPESMTELTRISAQGGTIMQGALETMAGDIENAKPSWIDLVEILSEGSAGDVRVYRFEYPDGQVFALRNVTDDSRNVRVTCSELLTRWDPISGETETRKGTLQEELCPNSTLYFSVSDAPFGRMVSQTELHPAPLEVDWTVQTERPNMVRLSGVEFLHAELGWLAAEDMSIMAAAKSRYPTGVPRAFFGYPRITFKGEFGLQGIDDSLSVLFENRHLQSLKVNGVAMDLCNAESMPVWDQSCSRVSINHLAHEGRNLICGVMVFDQIETSLTNNGLLCDGVMPNCDVYVSGSFVCTDGRLIAGDRRSYSMPIDLSANGWEQYDGVLVLSTKVEIDERVGDRVQGLGVDLASEDCLQVLLDGEPLGNRIVRPYHFRIDRLTPGIHELQLRITSTSANIMGEPSRWGGQVRLFVSRLEARKRVVARQVNSWYPSNGGNVRNVNNTLRRIQYFQINAWDRSVRHGLWDK